MVNNLPAAAGGHAPMMIGNETFSTSYTMIVREVSFFLRAVTKENAL